MWRVEGREGDGRWKVGGGEGKEGGEQGRGKGRGEKRRGGDKVMPPIITRFLNTHLVVHDSYHCISYKLRACYCLVQLTIEYTEYGSGFSAVYDAVIDVMSGKSSRSRNKTELAANT